MILELYFRDFISACSSRLMFSVLIPVSLKKNVTMTVKVLGVVKDGSTPYVNNQVHNRTRLLSCAQVCTCLNKTLVSCIFFKSVCMLLTLQIRGMRLLNTSQERVYRTVLFIMAIWAVMLTRHLPVHHFSVYFCDFCLLPIKDPFFLLELLFVSKSVGPVQSPKQI